MRWSTAATMVWAAIVLFGAGYEFLADVDTKKDIPFLTEVICRYFPWWVTLPVIVLLFWHFASRYFSPAYMRALRGG